MKTLFVVACAFLLSASAFANEVANGACAADVQKFCKGIEPGGGKILRCLSEHRSELSGPCRKEGETKRAAFMKLRVACKADAQKLCKDKRHPRDVFVCLKEKSKDLGTECKTLVEALPMPPTPKK